MKRRIIFGIVMSSLMITSSLWASGDTDEFVVIEDRTPVQSFVENFDEITRVYAGDLSLSDFSCTPDPSDKEVMVSCSFTNEESGVTHTIDSRRAIWMPLVFEEFYVDSGLDFKDIPENLAYSSIECSAYQNKCVFIPKD